MWISPSKDRDRCGKSAGKYRRRFHDRDPGGRKAFQATINLPGGYNIYNAIATVAAGHVLGLKDEVVIAALNSFECGFGRMEKFTIENTDIRMILIKNPAGCNQVLNFLSNTTQPALFVWHLMTATLTEQIFPGFGTWILKKLNHSEERLTGIWVTGRRADEMAMRFKYTGFLWRRSGVIKITGSAY